MANADKLYYEEMADREDLTESFLFQDDKEQRTLQERIQRVCKNCAEIFDKVFDKNIPDEQVRSQVFEQWDEKQLHELLLEINELRLLSAQTSRGS